MEPEAFLAKILALAFPLKLLFFLLFRLFFFDIFALTEAALKLRAAFTLLDGAELLLIEVTILTPVSVERLCVKLIQPGFRNA